MARVVGVFNTAHSPFLYMPPERWNEVRAGRALREDVPFDDLETNKRKKERIEAAFATRRQKMAALAPDGVIIFCGDPPFRTAMRKPDPGVGHAFLRPAESITDMKTPVIPVLINCYYAPQPTAMRCYEFGKAVRAAIDEHPRDRRVVVLGSGGLWHTPGAKAAYLNEEFDRTILAYLEKGDARGMAAYFDAYQIPESESSQDISQRGRQATGMPGFGGARAKSATGSPPRAWPRAAARPSSTTYRSTARPSASPGRTASCRKSLGSRSRPPASRAPPA